MASVSPQLKGIGCMVAASLLVTLNDVTMKWLAGTVPVGQILCLRGVVVIAVTAALALHEGGLHRLRVRSLRFQSIRAALVGRGHVLLRHRARRAAPG